MNSYLNAMKTASNYTRTENGAITHKTTESALLDMFAMGGAMRQRSDSDILLMFQKAFAENPEYALKCLFYLRDLRGGQGERRFFRIIVKDLARNHTEAMARNMEHVPEYGRWDDLYALVGTPLEKEMFAFMKEQLVLDVQCKTPSLMAKWLKSENASSNETRHYGELTRKAFGMTPKQYRKTLSILRSRINIVEKLMSENRWDEIEFDKIPSRAGLIYKNAFARRDIIKQKYETFAKDTTTKVNAEVLNPVDIAERIFKTWKRPSDTDVAMFQKYWDNLKDYYNGREEPGIAVVDVSGSMHGQPMAAAVAMGAYIAERGKGPFANHFITFSARPQLVEFEGTDIWDKFQRARQADWGMNTNLEATFEMLLDTALQNKTPIEDMPKTIYIFSDMEFDSCISDHTMRYDRWGYCEAGHSLDRRGINTLMEKVKQKWQACGYQMPRVIFWNLRSAQNNIPAIGEGFSYVSGFSMNMIEQILSGEDGYSLMMKKLDTERYAPIK